MIEAAHLPLDYPEAGVVEEDTLQAQTLTMAADLPEQTRREMVEFAAGKNEARDHFLIAGRLSKLRQIGGRPSGDGVMQIESARAKQLVDMTEMLVVIVEEGDKIPTGFAV